jgi:predicted DNA-binding transcriptional regulator AlpA
VTEPLLTAAEVAERLRVSRAAVYRGLPGLRPVRIGRRVRYRPADVGAVARGERPNKGESANETPSCVDRDLVQRLGDVVVEVLGAGHSALSVIEREWNAILEDAA